jgi:hypothetical protein
MPVGAQFIWAIAALDRAENLRSYKELQAPVAGR